MKTEQQIKDRMIWLEETFIDASLRTKDVVDTISLRSLKDRIRELRWVLEEIKK